MPAGDTPRLVVPSLEAPPPQRLYEDLYGARGHGANDSKAVQKDLHSDRTSATRVLAHARRRLLAWAASVLQHALRTPPLQPTA
jgi:DDE family transposase